MEQDSPRQRFVAGLRIGAGLAMAGFVLAVTFGALARNQGWGVMAPIVCSLVVFSGSAQFALVTALAGGGGIPAAVAAAGLINGRFIAMGVAVASDLPGGRARKALEAQAVVDASWAAAHLGGGRFDWYKLLGATIVQWPAWVGGTALGVALAPSEGLVKDLGLDVVFPGFFLLLLMDELRGSRRALVVTGVSALIAAGLVFVVPIGLALLGCSLAALIGLRSSSATSGERASTRERGSSRGRA